MTATALKLNPNLGEAWASAGLVAQFRQQFDRAEQCYRRAIELNPNYAPARFWLSTVLRVVGRLDEALAEAEFAVELDPLSARTSEGLGSALSSMGRWNEAEARLRKAIEIDPARPEPYSLIGRIKAYAQNHFAEAVSLMRQAAELDRGDPNRTVKLLETYWDLGEDSEAARLLAVALHRWPGDPRVNNVAALMKLQQSDLVSAARYALEIVEVAPRDVVALSILSTADLEKGDYAAAEVRYANAYPEFVGSGVPKVDRSNFRIAIHLARVLQKTNQSERARALLDRSEQVVRTLPRLGYFGYWVADVQIHALRGDRTNALAALRTAEQASWRGPYWRYYRDVDPNLASIRNEPEFKAIFADIERDMARQRARLAARPKDAPLELAETGT